MIRYVALSLIFFLFLVLNANAQYREPSTATNREGGGFVKKFYFGGGGGFSAGSNILNLSLSPLVGYKITERFSGGLQVTYQYVRWNSLRANNYGGGPFLRFNITQQFFTYAQYEYMNFGELVLPPDTGERFDFRSMFVGLGYSKPLAGPLALNITALYNVLYQDGTNSPYNSPILLRVGIVAGLF